MFTRYAALKDLPTILDGLLLPGETLLIDSHTKAMAPILNHLVKKYASRHESVYILFRQVFDILPIKPSYAYNYGDWIIVRRVFRDEDLIKAIQLIRDEDMNYRLFILLNPFKYVDEKPPPYSTSIADNIIMEINRALPLSIPTLIYNEHEPSDGRICRKIRLIRYDTYIEITNHGRIYLSRYL